MRVNPFQWFAREVENAEPGIVDTPAQMEDAARSIKATDAELIASLRRELAARDATIGRLQDELLKPAPITANRHCPNCAGLETTVRLLQDERRDLRKRLAPLELAVTRNEGWQAPQPFAET